MIRFFCVILFLLLFSVISLPMYLIVNIIAVSYTHLRAHET